MENITKFFPSEIISGLTKVFFIGVILWMVGIIFLLFQELFSPKDLKLRSYLYKAFRYFVRSIEAASYIGFIASPIFMLTGDVTKDNVSLLFMSLLVMSLSSFLRRK